MAKEREKRKGKTLYCVVGYLEDDMPASDCSEYDLNTSSIMRFRVHDVDGLLREGRIMWSHSKRGALIVSASPSTGVVYSREIHVSKVENDASPAGEMAVFKEGPRFLASVNTKLSVDLLRVMVCFLGYEID